MAQALELAAAGLWTDPNPHGDVPPGALTEARNVVIRRRGIIEPRPGLARTVYDVTPATGLHRLISYDGKLFGLDTSSNRWRNLTDGTVVQFGGGDSIDLIARNGMSEQSKQNLYVATSDGVLRITSGSDTSAQRAGMIRGIAAHTTGLTTFAPWLADGEEVAYRTVFVRTVNDLEIEGPPSGRYFVANSTGGNRSVNLTITLPSFLATGDRVRLYRSESAVTGTSTPGDELARAVDYVLTSADISAGEVTLGDRTPPNGRGASLYTNATQQGSLQENLAPWLATDIAEYAGMMFYGGHVGCVRALFALSSLSGNKASGRPGLAYDESETATASSGSPTLTSVSFVADWMVGLYVTDTGATAGANGGYDPATPGTAIPAGTYIAAVDTGASEITLSQNAAGSGAITIVFGDWLDVAGTRLFFSAGNDADRALVDIASSESDTARNIAAVGSSVLADTHSVQSLSDDDGSLLVEAIDPTAQPFDIESSTDYTTWTPSIGTAADGEELVATDSGGQAHLAWSKADQPESVPLVNYARVGDERRQIWRMVATRTRLFVFKDDGVWTVSGFSPESIRIDEYDQTLRLVNLACVVQLQGILYAWTNRGVVALTDGGVVEVSEPAIARDLAPIQSALLDAQDSRGPFMAASEEHEELYLGVPATASSTGYVRTIYVYNAKTGAWTTWETEDDDERWGSAVVHEGELTFGGIDNGLGDLITRKERAPGTSGAKYTYDDTDATITIDAVDGNNLTLSASVNVGDYLDAGAGVEGVVVADLGSNEYTVAAISGATFSTGSVTVYGSYECRVEWTTRTSGNPGVGKHWRDVTLYFAGLVRLARAALSFTSDLVTASASITHEVEPPDTTARIRQLRGFVTRNHARCAALAPKLTIRQATAGWALQMLSLIFEPTSERVR